MCVCGDAHLVRKTFAPKVKPNNKPTSQCPFGRLLMATRHHFQYFQYFHCCHLRFTCVRSSVRSFRPSRRKYRLTRVNKQRSIKIAVIGLSTATATGLFPYRHSSILYYLARCCDINGSSRCRCRAFAVLTYFSSAFFDFEVPYLTLKT